MEYWKYKAIEKLKDYPAQQVALLNIPDDVARLKSLSCSIHSATMDATPVQGGGSTREDRLLSNIVERAELAEMLRRAKYACGIVERGLAVLDGDERHILDRMYMHRAKGYIDRLMADYGLEDVRSVYKRADKALLHFTVAMYGATEN